MVDDVLRVTRGQRRWIQQSRCAFDKELLHKRALSRGGPNALQLWAMHGVFTFMQEGLELRRLPFAVKGTWEYCQQQRSAVS
jgi:hypothetical protein